MQNIEPFQNYVNEKIAKKNANIAWENAQIEAYNYLLKEIAETDMDIEAFLYQRKAQWYLALKEARTYEDQNEIDEYNALYNVYYGLLLDIEQERGFKRIEVV